MKKNYLFLFLISLIVITAVITNPKIAIHKESVSVRITEDIVNGNENGLTNLIGGKLINVLIEKSVSVDNYILFSLTKFKKKGEIKTVGFGVFGTIFLNQNVEESLKELNPIEEDEKSSIKNQPKELFSENKNEGNTANKNSEIKVNSKEIVADTKKKLALKKDNKESEIVEKETLSTKQKISNDIPIHIKKQASNSKGNFGTGNDGLGSDDGIGPGISGKIGSLGSGEGKPPIISNPTKDSEGQVVIELIVDKKGNVVDVKVLANHRMTTTTDPVLLNHSKKEGYHFTFKPDSNRATLSKGLRIINYKLK